MEERNLLTWSTVKIDIYDSYKPYYSDTSEKNIILSN